MKLYRWMILILLASLLSGCGLFNREPEETTPMLVFDPKLTMYESGEITFKIGVANESKTTISPVDDVNIEAVVMDDQGVIRNQMTIVEIETVPAGGSVHPLTYKAVYETGRYVMRLTGNNLPTLEVPFEVIEEEGVQKLVSLPDWIDPYTEFVITVPEL